MKVESLISPQMIEEQHLKNLTGSVNSMHHVLEEAGQLLKLVWRVSVPASKAMGDSGSNQQVGMHKQMHQINPITFLQ